MRNPAKSRPGEEIGGGFFVFRRGRRTGRIRPSWLAFEHPGLEAACAEADRLAMLHPGRAFVVVAQIYFAPVATGGAREPDFADFVQSAQEAAA